MKKAAYIILFTLVTFAFSSCKQCATCTSEVTDILSTDTIETVEFCEKGHVYDNQLSVYQRSGWDCVEEN